MKVIFKLANLNIVYRIKNKRCQIARDVKLENVNLEGYNRIGPGSKLINSSLGIGTYIGEKTNLKNVAIGKYCSIGSYVKNTVGDHPTTKFISTHPAFFSINKSIPFTFRSESVFKELKFFEGNNLVVIGNDVWIGDSVTLLSGIRIGNGAIIGAGSLVTKDVPSYAIVYGVPAQIKKYRFSNNEIELIEKSQWWNKSFEWLKLNVEKFDSFELFKLLKF